VRASRRWIVDVQRFMAAHLAWLAYFGVLWIVALDILDVSDASEAKLALLYVTAVPVVLATLALRKVVTNVRPSCSSRHGCSAPVELTR
jgi:hypothetical protein